MADPFIHGHGPRPLGADGDHGGDDGLYPLVGDMGEHATSAPGPIDLSAPCTRGQSRIQHGFDVRPDLCAVDSKLSPRELLRRCYVDSLVHDPDSLRHLIDIMGPDRIALGSDYPFPLGEHVPGALIESMALAHRSKERLLSGTALEFLGMKASTFLGEHSEVIHDDA